MEYVVAAAIGAIQATIADKDARLAEIRAAGKADLIYQALRSRIQDGWPSSSASLTEKHLTQYFGHLEALLLHNDLILFGPRLLIPQILIRPTLRRLQAAHQGTAKTLDRAKGSVWWPTWTNDVTQAVQRCSPCQAAAPAQAHKPFQQG